MKVAVCTAHDAPYKSLADVTLPSLVQYAQRHGYNLYYQPDIPDDEKDACKARIYSELFRSGEYGRDDLFMWIDTDALVMNQNIRVEALWAKYATDNTHFLWSYNWDGPNSGVWIARFSDEAENYIRVYTCEQFAMGWGDQNAMNQKMLYPPFKDWVTCIRGKAMNASPYEEYGLQDQDHKNRVNNYEPGDWILHLPGMESSRRMELLKSYAGQIVQQKQAPHPLRDVLGDNCQADWPVVRGMAEALLTPRGEHECEDWAIWHAVYNNNEYELKENFQAEDVVIDIGMQSGSFTCLAYARGSRNVLGFEVDTDSFNVAKQNVAYLHAGAAIQVFNKAVVGEDHQSAFYVPGSMQTNPDGIGLQAQVVAFDDILARFEKVRYVKIDVEGAEYPILYTSKQLAKVQEISGEYHCASVPVSQHIPNRSAADLEAFLQAQGFKTRFKPCGEDTGNFWAWR